jgi:uncharacterized protein DUF4087
MRRRMRKTRAAYFPRRLQSSALVHMKLQLTLVGGLLLIAMPMTNTRPGLPTEPLSTDFETRCGWFSNPTPANISFYDREAEWTIGAQGGYQVPGDWPWPTFKAGQWVVTNAGDHGYGCACLRLRVNKQTHEVIEIKTSRARPLTQCRRDSSLKKWNRRLT